MSIDHQLDAIRLLLLAEPRDFAVARAQLGPADGTTTELGQLVVTKNETLIFRGHLAVHGPVVLEHGATLWVLGDCTVDDVVYSKGLQYSVLMVGGLLSTHLLRTAGEVIALGGIEANTVMGEYNDHSTFSPVINCKTYIALERYDVIDTLKAETKLVDRDTIEYGLALLLPGLYPRLPNEDDRTFDQREQAFFTRALQPPSPSQVSNEELETLRAQVRSSDPNEQRAARIAIRRKHLLQLTPELADVIRRDPQQSADSLELLGALKATEALVGLLDGSVKFGKTASAVARAFEHAGWLTQAENAGGWVFSVRPSANEPWRYVP